MIRRPPVVPVAPLEERPPVACEQCGRRLGASLQRADAIGRVHTLLDLIAAHALLPVNLMCWLATVLALRECSEAVGRCVLCYCGGGEEVPAYARPIAELLEQPARGSSLIEYQRAAAELANLLGHGALVDRTSSAAARVRLGTRLLEADLTLREKADRSEDRRAAVEALRASRVEARP